MDIFFSMTIPIWLIHIHHVILVCTIKTQELVHNTTYFTSIFCYKNNLRTSTAFALVKNFFFILPSVVMCYSEFGYLEWKWGWLD
jgi:hypothetical protein